MIKYFSAVIFRVKGVVNVEIKSYLFFQVFALNQEACCVNIYRLKITLVYIICVYFALK